MSAVSHRRPSRPAPAARAAFAGLFFALLAGTTADASAQSITDLGVLRPDDQFAMGLAVSADGSTIAGVSSVQFFEQTRSFVWRQSTGAVYIGEADDAINTFAQAISADGSVLAGAYYSANRDHAFRWTSAEGVQDLGSLPDAPFGASATGISADGSVVGGTSSSPDGDRAFRWTASGGMQSLGTLTGGTFSWGFATSGDGNAMTGIADTNGAEHAFVWTSAGGMQALAPIGEDFAGGLAISADGSAVAGYSGAFAARWVNGVPQSLGCVDGGTFSMAYAISGDGRSVGGVSDDAAGDAVACLWSPSLGMVDLNAYLPTLGVDLSGWTLTTVAGLSFDGTVITGGGFFDGQERGWVVTIPAPGAGALLALGGLLGARRRRA